jgi:hypothetical protein
MDEPQKRALMAQLRELTEAFRDALDANGGPYVVLASDLLPDDQHFETGAATDFTSWTQ